MTRVKAENKVRGVMGEREQERERERERNTTH